MIGLEEFREFCLNLGSVTEKMPFGKFAKRYESILAFYIFGHMFCFIDVDNFTWVNVKSTPSEVADIREKYISVGNPINQNFRHWIQLEFNGDIHDAELYRIVRRAFDIVSEKYSKNSRKR